jgi:Ca2+-binding EF-hand superfamily protein
MMDSYEESALETYCGLCNKILNPPFEVFQVFSLDGAPSHALCYLCRTHMKKVIEIIGSLGISWGTDSKTGVKWMKSSGAFSYKRENSSSFEDYLKLEVSEEDIEMINKDVNAGRTDPEIFEWEYHEIIKRIMKPTYREDLCKVLKAYCAKNPGIGYCQGMSYICMWLLLFLSPESAFFMFSYLVEKILLPDFYSNSHHGNSLNGFYIESSTISGFLKKCVPVFEKACMPADSFSDFFSLQLLIQLFVNAIDFESCTFLWTKLMEEGNIALIRGVVALVSVSKEAVASGEHPLNISKAFPEKKLKIDLEQEYSQLSEYISQDRVNSLRKRAKESRARQWQKCEKLSLRKLEKVSNFDSGEILELSLIFQQMIKTCERVADGRSSARFTLRLPEGTQDSFEAQTYESGLRKEQFLQIVTSINPKLQQSAELIFEKFDEDKSGLLDFRELTICLSVMCKGGIEDKLKICFDVYDADKSGFLQPDEMEELIKSITKPYKDSEDSGLDVDEIQRKMRMLCEKSGDILCFRDFVLAVKSDPMLYDCFSDYLGASASPMETLSKANSKETYSCQNTIYKGKSESESSNKRQSTRGSSSGNNCCACNLM